jgi:hypothetical protein
MSKLVEEYVVSHPGHSCGNLTCIIFIGFSFLRCRLYVRVQAFIW